MPPVFSSNVESESRSHPAREAEWQTGPLAILGGCGHVGLPLGLAFARKGYQVALIDTSPERVAEVNAGHMPFHEDDAEPLLAQTLASRLLEATTDTAVLEKASAIIVTIGTPVDEYLDPSVCSFDHALEQLLSPGASRPASGAAQHGLSRRHRPVGPTTSAAGP